MAELAGWSIDAEDAAADYARRGGGGGRGRAERTALPEAFAAASGEQELHIDAGKVKHAGGVGVDVKVAVFAGRPRGPAATADDYEQRELPAPDGAVGGGRHRGLRGRLGVAATRRARRLGVCASRLSVLGDGAEWIWNLVAAWFFAAAQLLDVVSRSWNTWRPPARQALGEEGGVDGMAKDGSAGFGGRRLLRRVRGVKRGPWTTRRRRIAWRRRRGAC